MRRVCYVGSFTGPTDEGMRNVADSILRAQAQYCEVLGVNPSSILFRPRRLKSFHPDIMHYLSGPSIVSLILLELARMETGCKHTVVTATHPWVLGMRLLPGKFKPDLVLVQSRRQVKLLEGLFDHLAMVHNGVDLNKFAPMEGRARKVVRNSLGISDSQFAILHVGNLREGRNAEILKNLMDTPNTRVIMISSTSVGLRSRRVINELRSSGVSILDRFLPNIEEIYGACDCYVFPTEEVGRAIEVPLSVLEAMACNLPVVTTRYGGLPDLFSNGKYFRFVNSASEISHAVEEMRTILTDCRLKCTTRDMVSGLSWDSIAKKLGEIYGQIMT